MPSRRGFIVVAVWLACAARSALADEITVPAALQAKLMSRAASYDRNFAARAPTRAAILIVTTASAASAQFTGQLRQALSEEATVGGVPHDESEIAFTGVPALVAKVKADKPAIVVLSPGLSEADTKAFVGGLGELPTLVVAATPDLVSAGAALGFDLVSGRPKLLVNLKQAQKQGVQFGADLLRLAQVVEP